MNTHHTLLRLLASLRSRCGAWHRRWLDRRALAGMSERELADLGIGRGEIDYVLTSA
jgi:uncharacterized protein YjiS (DUF1127 family)